MHFSLGTELTTLRRSSLPPRLGPVNTAPPHLSGGSVIGNALSVSDGVWTGNGSMVISYQWLRGGVIIPGEIANSYVLQDADDQALVSCRVQATDNDGSATAEATALSVTYPAPVFSQQPVLTPANGVAGDVFAIDLGTAGPNTVLSIVAFSLDGSDRSSGLNGLTWDSAGEVAGTVNLRVMATNSGGSVMSDVVTATLISASATLPDTFPDANWTLADAGAGGALCVSIAAMADNGGAPISDVEYQLNGSGSWFSSGLTDAGGFAIGGLQDGQGYSLALRAVNSVGAGTASVAKSATPDAGSNPTVGVTTINRATGEISMTGVSEPGTYFGLVNYNGAPMGGAAIEAAVNAGSTDASISFPLVSGANSTVYDKSNVAVGTAYFHGVIKNAAGAFSLDTPLAFLQPFVDVAAPVLVSSAPAHGAVNQSTATDILLSFDEVVQLGTGQIVLFDVTNSSVVETFDMATGAGDQGGAVSAQNQVVTINPSTALQEGIQFAIRTIESSAIVDASGNGFAGWSDDNSQLSFTTAIAGAGAVFMGDADSTIWAVNHVLGAGSSSQTALPSSYGAGKYVIMAAVAASKDVTTLALDGVAAVLRGNGMVGSERVAIYEAMIPGGGNGLVELGLSGSADDVGVAVWEVGSRSFVGSFSQEFANRKTNLPADLSMNTNAGDAVLAAVMHSNTSATSTWTGLSEAVASRVLSDRVFASAHNLSANGGSPETFDWAPSIDWVGVGAALAIYR